MGRDLNSVLIVGRICSDPEFKVTPNGKELLKFRLANNSAYSDDANFFDVTIWGKTAAALKEYLLKGKQIATQGRLQQKRWETKDGQKRSQVGIVAENVQLLGGNKPQDNAPSQEAVAPTPDAIDTATKKLKDIDTDGIPF